MSITLTADLSSAVVGSSGSIKLQQSGMTTGPKVGKPTIQMYNDSGNGLQVKLPSSQLDFYVPAKGHAEVQISEQEAELDWRVVNQSSGIQVNTLVVVYFYPWEQVLNFSSLGTALLTTQAQTIVDTGRAAGSDTLFAEPIGDTSPNGVTEIKNNGIINLGDSTYRGSIVLNGNGSVLVSDIKGAGLGQIVLNAIFNDPDPGMNMTDNTGNNSITWSPTQQSMVMSGVTKIFLNAAGQLYSAVPINSAIPGNVRNGSVSGTFTLYEALQGVSFKMSLIILNNYRDAANQALSLTTPYTFQANVWTGWDVGVSGNGGFQVLKTGVAQNFAVFTGLAAAGGTEVTQNTMFRASFGTTNNTNGFDAVQILSMTATHTGVILIIGI